MATRQIRTIREQTIAAAGRCEKGYACLEAGPKCRATRAVGSGNALLVRCVEIGPCAYKTGSYRDGASDVSICSCPVRLEFFRVLGT